MNVTLFFLVSGATQLFWVIPVLKRWSNLWYYVGIGGTVILIALFVIAVPGRGLPVSELEVTIELSQIAFIISSIIIVKDRTRPGGRKESFSNFYTLQKSHTLDVIIELSDISSR